MRNQLYIYKIAITFDPPCPEYYCCDGCEVKSSQISYQHIWTQPIECKISMFADFTGNIYDYISKLTKPIISLVGPNVTVAMLVYLDEGLANQVAYPFQAKLGQRIFIKTYIDFTPDPSMILYLQKCVAHPVGENASSEYVLFDLETGNCAEDPGTQFVRMDRRDVAVFSFMAFRFCNIPSGGIFLSCSVVLCLPGDTSPACKHPCHTLQHPSYAVGRSASRLPRYIQFL